MGVDVNFIHELLINLFQGDGNYSYNSTNLATIPGSPASVPVGFAPCAAVTSAAAANATFCLWLADAVGANVGDGINGEALVHLHSGH